MELLKVVSVSCTAVCLLLHLTGVCGDTSSYPPLPVLFAEGTHYDVGHQIVSL